MPATLGDVARLAGVSLSTASRSLNPAQRHPVNMGTRQRVLEIAERLSYRPNPMARGLRSRRLPTIAVVVHDVTDPYFAEIVRGAADEAGRNGFLTFVCSSRRDAAAELRSVEMLRRSRVSAVLFAAGGFVDRGYLRAMRDEVDAIRAYGGSVVALAPRVEAWAMEVCDNRGGARLMTEHLLRLGHRRIAFISGPPAVRTSHDRQEAYEAAMGAAGQVPAVEPGDFTRDGGRAATARLLDARETFTALLVSNDMMALGVLSELARRRIAVPRELSVGVFGDIPTWEYTAPRLTAVRVELAEIGAAGVRRALALLDGGGRADQPRVRVHPVALVIRDSTAAPRRAAAMISPVGA